MSGETQSLPKLRLCYFDMPGRAEAIRLSCVLGDLPFEDDRVTYDQYEGLKAEGKLPLGQLPVLFIGDQPYVQSIAILRYIGKLTGLYPKDNHIQALAVDQVCDTIQDLYASANPLYQHQEINRRIHIGEALASSNGDFHRMLSFLNNVAERSEGEYLTGSEVTIADLAFTTVARWLSSGTLPGVPVTILSRYPRLQACVSRVLAIEKVADYLERTGVPTSPIMSPARR